MKNIPTLTYLATLIELHEIKDYWCFVEGNYYKLDLVNLFNRSFGDISKTIKEGNLFHK